MMSRFSIFVFLLAALLSVTAEAQKDYFNYKESMEITATDQPPEEPLSLWFKQPAAIWEDALPLGNGRVGAMIYGGVAKERITLNENTLWAGPPKPVVKENISATVDKVRELLFAGKYVEAQALQQSAIAGRISPRSYQLLSEIVLDFEHEGKVSQY